MTKKGIIWLLVLLALLVLTGVLFGVVFCLRTQNVTILGEGKLTISKEAIIKTADLKNGSSIFLLDKEKAINNLETTYPNLKVVQIKTISLTRIEIIVRARHEMFYTKIEENYYILDEELKVIEIRNEDEIVSRPVSDLSQISEGLLNISVSTKESDFVGSKEQQTATKNLYIAMVSTVTKGQGAEQVYYTREDVRAMIKDVQFEKFDTFNKILIKTAYGIKIDIENPQENMTDKINLAFSAIKQFVLDSEDNREESGTIKIYYDLSGEQKCVYVLDTPLVQPEYE